MSHRPGVGNPEIIGANIAVDGTMYSLERLLRNIANLADVRLRNRFMSATDLTSVGCFSATAFRMGQVCLTSLTSAWL